MMNALNTVITHVNQEFVILFSALLFLSFFSVFIKKRIIASRIAYVPLNNLFTPAELSFYHVLKQSVSDAYEVFGKVRIADVVQPKKSLSSKLWWIAFNRISSKHFDYVICDPETLSIVAVIELDDSSHLKGKTIKRDRFVNEVCRSANVKLIRFKAKKYHVNQVRDVIDDILNS